jgi:hypothetical protein
VPEVLREVRFQDNTPNLSMMVALRVSGLSYRSTKHLLQMNLLLNFACATQEGLKVAVTTLFTQFSAKITSDDLRYKEDSESSIF